jgi:circadian clock protein KaiB
MFKFRLYVAGGTSNSVQAIANFKVLCAQHLFNRCELEIVDVLREPGRALADGILMTPTLVKVAPAPVTRIIGTLSQAQATTLQALGLEVRAA